MTIWAQVSPARCHKLSLLCTISSLWISPSSNWDRESGFSLCRTRFSGEILISWDHCFWNLLTNGRHRYVTPPPILPAQSQGERDSILRQFHMTLLWVKYENYYRRTRRMLHDGACFFSLFSFGLAVWVAVVCSCSFAPFLWHFIEPQIMWPHPKNLFLGFLWSLVSNWEWWLSLTVNAPRVKDLDLKNSSDILIGGTY